MSQVTYKLVKLAEGQKCFGAGEWCVEKTTKEIIASAPDRHTAQGLAERLAKADGGEFKNS